MRTPVPEYLHDLIEELRGDRSGEVADYIPALAQADPEAFAVSLTTVDGRTYAVGDTEREFSIQSISKPFAYAAALMDRGNDAVLAKVGLEPSGEAFNELSLEDKTHRPKNPMINAGAIATHQLLLEPGASRDDRVERLVTFFSELAGRELSIDTHVYDSEMATADRNLAIAHMLRNYGVIDDDPHAVVSGYTAQCAINVSVKDLSLMGATLANGGVHPLTGRRAVDARIARQTLSVMAAAGMYDAAGAWLAQVGIPAKSGVSGGMLGSLPGQAGIGIFSPRLDSHGNSVRGVKMCERLSEDMGLHVIGSEAHGGYALRSVREVEGRTVLKLQGAIFFNAAESVLHYLQENPVGTPSVLIDLNRVHHMSNVGRRMILEAIRRLGLDGHDVEVDDPEGSLTTPTNPGTL